MPKTKPKPKAKRSLAAKLNPQVAGETALRFDPQKAELDSTLRDLRGQLGGDVSRAHAAVQGVALAAKNAGPEITKAYGQGSDIAQSAQQDLITKLGSLPGGGGLLSGAAARDAEGTKRRLGEAMANAQAELSSRKTDAASGEALQIANLTARYGSDSARVRDKLAALAGEAGAFAAKRQGDLTDAGRARRNARLTAGVDASGHVIPGGKADPKLKAKAKKKERLLPGGTKIAPPATQQKIKDSVAAALAQIKPYTQGKGKLPRAKVAALFKVGASRGVDEAEYQRLVDDGMSPVDARRQAATAAIAKIPESILSVALDIAYDGAISRHGRATGKGNVGELHKRGVVVRDLGYPIAPKKT